MIQIVSGVFLGMFCTPHVDLAFAREWIVFFAPCCLSFAPVVSYSANSHLSQQPWPRHIIVPRSLKAIFFVCYKLQFIILRHRRRIHWPTATKDLVLRSSNFEQLPFFVSHGVSVTTKKYPAYYIKTRMTWHMRLKFNETHHFFTL